MEVGRERRIEVIRRRLLRRSTPRFQVSLILLLTAVSGFLTSYCLLHAGVLRMGLRYPLAILLAYCAFLLLLRFWLWLQRHDLDVNLDPPTLDFHSAHLPGSDASFAFGRGSDFGGGGAGGSWGDSLASSTPSAGGRSFTDSISVDLDLEEGWLVVLAVLALLGGLVVTFYVVYIAPALLAEILLDGVLVAGLYGRVKGIERRHWLRAAVRRTLLPAILAATFFAIAGYALQKVAPRAHSIAGVWQEIVKD